MILSENKERIGIVGYEKACITRELLWWFKDEFDGDVTIIDPSTFIPDHSYAYVVSIARDLQERKNIVEKLIGYTSATFIHNTSTIHANAKIMQGCIISPYASVYTDAVLMGHNIVAPYSMVSHRTTIGVGTILQPTTVIAGTCNIGDYCLFNIRSTVIDKINICDNVCTGAGSLITKDIQESGFYVGSPARRVNNRIRT